MGFNLFTWLKVPSFSDKHFAFLAAVSVMNVFVIVALNDKCVVFILTRKRVCKDHRPDCLTIRDIAYFVISIIC